MPLAVGAGATASASSVAGSPEVAVSSSYGQREVTLQMADTKGQQVYVADADPAGHAVSAPRAWTSDITVRPGSQAFADDGASDQTRVVYGVDPAGVIRSRTVLYNSPAVLNADIGQRATQWSVSRAGVALQWWQPAGADVRWTVSVDGVVRARTSGTTWTDRHSDQTRSHTYTISGAQVVTEKGRTNTRPFYYQVSTVPSDDTAVGMALTDSRVRSLATNTDVTTQARYPTTQMIVSYRAFIAPKYVKAPGPCLEKHIKGVAYYGGDNRSWDADVYGGRSSRLLAQSSVDFHSTYSEESFYRFVGTTKAYDKNRKQILSKKADISSVSRDSRNSGTASRFEGAMTFQGGNPLCFKSAAINGIVRYTLRSNGSMRLFGNHDQAPNHELLYYWFSGGRTKTACAYRRSIKSFNHLLPNYENAYYDITFNPKQKAYPRC